MLTGYALAINSRENTACYGPGEPGALGFEAMQIPCSPAEGAKVHSLDWALPGSENGVSVTCFDYVKATDNTKPRIDAQKVITVLNYKDGGTYLRVLVPDDYTLATFVEACCAGCDPIPAVTIPPPLIGWTECVIAPPTPNNCVFYGTIQISALTGSNTTWTATGYGYDANGTAIVFSPTTSTGTTVALLAAAMQTNWASELGSGTFVATGNNIEFHSTNGSRVFFVISQS